MQILPNFHHLLIGLPGLLILPRLEVRIAENPVGVAVLRIKFDRLRRLHGRLLEGMFRVQHKGQMPGRAAVRGGERETLLERLFSQREVGRIAALPRFLDIGVAEPVVSSGVVWVSMQHPLVDLDGAVSGGPLGQQGERPRDQEQDENEGGSHVRPELGARKGGGRSPSTRLCHQLQGFAPSSPQSICRRSRPSWGVGKNGKTS